MNFAGVVVLLMVSLITIAYMASKLLNMSSMEAFAKVELYELFISILILLFAWGFFEASSQISIAIAGGDPFEIARNFHSRIMLEGVYPAIQYCYQMIFLFSTLNSFQVRPNDSVWTWVLKVCPGADVIVGVFNLLSYGLIVVLASMNAHLFILGFLEATMKDFFLPAGVLLRFLPPTRKAGVFIIAMAIAFHSIYPAAYALHFQILDEIAKIEGHDYYAPFDSAKATGILIFSFATPFAIGSIIGGASKLLDLVPGAMGVQTFIGFIASEAFLSIIQPSLFLPVIKGIAELSLVTFFLPALSMIFCIAFINGFTNFIEHKIG